MSYLVMKPKSKKEEAVLKQIAELLNVDYKKITLDEYIRQIAARRKEMKAGKKVALKDIL